MAQWTRFVAALANRYKGRSVAYEIENEPYAEYGVVGRPARRRLFQAHCPADTSPMPRDDGLRLDDHERRSQSSPAARERHREPPVYPPARHSPRSRALQHAQLMPKCEDF